MLRLDHLAVAAVLAGSATLGSAAVGVSAIADGLPDAGSPAQVRTPEGGAVRDGGACDHRPGDERRIDPRQGL